MYSLDGAHRVVPVVILEAVAVIMAVVGIAVFGGFIPVLDMCHMQALAAALIAVELLLTVEVPAVNQVLEALVAVSEVLLRLHLNWSDS